MQELDTEENEVGSDSDWKLRFRQRARSILLWFVLDVLLSPAVTEFLKYITGLS